MKNPSQKDSVFVYLLISYFFIVPYLWKLPSNGIGLVNDYLLNIYAVFGIIPVIIYYLRYYRNNILIRIPISAIFILAFILILVLQLPSLKGYKTTNYNAIGLFTIILVLSLIINNIKFNLSKLLFFIATAILANCYLQIITSALSLLNIKYLISLPGYSQTGEPAKLTFNILAGYGSRIGGIILQPNLLADLLLWGIFANIYLWLTTKDLNISKLILFTSNTILISIFIALTYSRFTILVDFFIFTYAIICYIKRHHKVAALTFLHATSIFICLILATFGLFNFAYSNVNVNSVTKQPVVQTKNPMQQTLNKLSTNTEINNPEKLLDDSNRQRIVFWTKGMYMFKEHPFFGVGWGRYPTNFFSIQTPLSNQTLPQFALPLNSHNLFIQILAETGIIGFLVCVGLFIYWIKIITLQPIQFQILPLGVLITLFIHSQVEYPLFYAPFLLCMVIIMCIIEKNYLFTIKNSLFNFSSTLIIAVTSWQLFTGVNNFLLLLGYKNPCKEIENSNSKLTQTIINKYRISYNPFWSYYVDEYLAQTIRLQCNPKDSDICMIFYNITKQVEEVTPYPEFSLILATNEEMLGNSVKAREYVYKVLDNYPNFKNRIIDIIKTITSKNKTLQDTMLKYIYTRETTINDLQ